MSDAVRRRVVASGRVQGVFFRDAVRRRACASSVSGWIRNRADGKVEAVFEGSESAVTELLVFCRTGPGQAQVRTIEIADERPEGLSGFSVR